MKKEDIKILLVDDEISLIDAMKKLLARDGYQVSAASSGKEAIELSRDTAFNIIFLDVNMPDLNGLETYKQIREIIPDAPVVMITGYGRSLKELIEEAQTLGVKDCINKPFKIQQIIKSIETYVPHDA